MKVGSIYPICSGSPDNIVGVLSAKDYFRLKNKTGDEVLKRSGNPILSRRRYEPMCSSAI